MRPEAISVPKMPTAMSTIVASDRPQQHDPAAHAGVLGAVCADASRVREVVEAIPGEGRFRHQTMLPGRAGVRRRSRSVAGGAVAPRAGVAKPAEALDEHRIVLLRLGGVDEAAEQLVVPRRRHAEVGADRLFLRARVPTPLALEARGWRGRGR